MSLCEGLQQPGLAASKAYHEFLRDLEARLFPVRPEKAFRNRDAAILELTTHRSHAHKKVAARFQPSKRQSA